VEAGIYFHYVVKIKEKYDLPCYGSFDARESLRCFGSKKQELY
jgi:hypothetical protein